MLINCSVEVKKFKPKNEQKKLSVNSNGVNKISNNQASLKDTTLIT